jgi:predicted ATPase
MNVSSVRLRNFRGFHDATLPLKPLTVLLGPNSAGKSAFGHALATMAHAHRVFANTPQASLTPSGKDREKWPVDLGDTDDLRTTGREGPVTVTLATRGGPVELGFGGLTQTRELLLSFIGHPSGEHSAATAVQTPATSELQPVATSESIARGTVIETANASIQLQRLNEQQWADHDEPAILVLDGLLLKAVKHHTGTSRVLSGAARDDVQALFESLTYLRANRKRPSRGFEDYVEKIQSLGYSGECTPSILQRHGSDTVAYRAPPAIPNSVEEARASSGAWNEVQESLVEAVDSWLRRLGLATTLQAITLPGPDSHIRLRVTLEGQHQRDITEIGFGVSQVIPVLVAGLRQSPGSVCIVDLPEAHLHPRPQAALADFFCSLALSGTTTLVETHSEMFFHRLRLRAAMDPALASQIAVYFVDAPIEGTCSTPRSVGLGYADEIRWPEGFLHEAWEIETQINAVREAQRLGRV